MINGKRITWLDMAKGYGIILVIMGHIGFGMPFRMLAYSFHVPLFFLLSGYLFNVKNDFKTFFKKKCKSILVPYFGLGIPMLCFDFLLRWQKNEATVASIKAYIIDILVQNRKWTLWFLACLFFLNLLFYGAVKLLKSNTKITIFSVILAIAGIFYAKYIAVALPWDLDVVMVAFPFFTAGYLYHQNSERLDKYFDNLRYSIPAFVGFALIDVVGIYFNQKISGETLDIFYLKYGFAPLTYISAFSGIVCVIIFSKWFTLKPVQYIGRNSIVFFAWHQTIFIQITQNICEVLNISIDSSVKGYAYKLLELLLIIVMLTIANEIVTKTKLRILIGKSE